MFDVEQIRAEAYVNHGRWIVNCPIEGCNNAEFAYPGTTVARCSMCGINLDVVHPKDCAGIERLLTGRPVVNRNWLPGETLDDLAKENHDHEVSS